MVHEQMGFGCVASQSRVEQPIPYVGRALVFAEFFLRNSHVSSGKLKTSK